MGQACDRLGTVIARGHSVSYTFEDYIAHEEATNAKHEYLDGQIYAKAGGTPEHSALAVSVATQLANQLRGGRCRVHSSDLRIRVLETGLATYPDVTVVCGPWERDPKNARTVVNPSVVIEVLSGSTEAYDRGEKLEHYKRIAALGSVVLVAHDRRELEVWTRLESGSWGRALFVSGQVAELPAINCNLSVDAVYDDAAEPT
jgi:Uma2 family endonuclease